MSLDLPLTRNVRAGPLAHGLRRLRGQWRLPRHAGGHRQTLSGGLPADHQGLQPARPRRRGFPHRHEVELRADGQCITRAQIPDLQRRRDGARHLQGPPAAGVRPPPADRGHDLLGLHDPGGRGLYLYPRGVPQGGEITTGRHRRLLRPRATWARTSWAPATTSTCRCTPAPVATSAARRRR